MAVKRGKLIVVSAPSGCGKTTIVERLLKRNKSLARSISYTTRAPRGGEENGRDYFFVTKDEFSSLKRRGFFLESAEVFGQSYGTSKQYVLDQIAQGVGVVLTIDVQGMKQLRRQVDREISLATIFIMPPSLRVLKARLAKRKTETKRQIADRLKIAQKEMAARSLYDYVVVNRNIDEAVKEIEAIVQ